MQRQPWSTVGSSKLFASQALGSVGPIALGAACVPHSELRPRSCVPERLLPSYMNVPSSTRGFTLNISYTLSSSARSHAMPKGLRNFPLRRFVAGAVVEAICLFAAVTSSRPSYQTLGRPGRATKEPTVTTRLGSRSKVCSVCECAVRSARSVCATYIFVQSESLGFRYVCAEVSTKSIALSLLVASPLYTNTAARPDDCGSSSSGHSVRDSDTAAAAAAHVNVCIHSPVPIDPQARAAITQARHPMEQ